MIRDVFSNVLARLVSAVLMLAAAVIVARALGPEGQGRYFVAMTFGTLVVQFANLGLQSSNVYFLSQDRSLLKSLLVNSIWLSLILGMGCAVLVGAILFASGVNWGIDAYYLWLGAAMAGPRMFYILGSYLLVGLSQIRAVNWLQIALNGGTLCCLAGGIAVGAEAGGLLWLTFAVWAITATGLLAYLAALAMQGGCTTALHERTSRSHLRFDKPHVPTTARFGGQSWQTTLTALRFRYGYFRDGLRYSLKAYLICLFGFLLLRLNVFLLQMFRGESEVGVYSVATQAADALLIVPTSLALVLLPRLIQNPQQAWTLLCRRLGEMALFMLLACATTAVLVGPAVNLMFSAAYQSAAEMLLWMLPGIGCLGLTSVVSQYLAAVGIPRRSLEFWALAVVAQLAVGIWLVPRYGGNGAAATLSAVYGLNFALQLGLAYRVAQQRRTKFAGVGDEANQMAAATTLAA